MDSCCIDKVKKSLVSRDVVEPSVFLHAFTSVTIVTIARVFPSYLQRHQSSPAFKCRFPRFLPLCG